MQVECIRAFGHHEPGDLAEVPDGASVDPVHWEVMAPGGEAEPADGGAAALVQDAGSGQATVPPGAADAARELLDGLAERAANPAKEGMLWHPHQG